MTEKSADTATPQPAAQTPAQPAASNPMRELEILSGQGVTRTCMVNGAEVKFHIRPVKTGKIPALVAAAGPAIAIWSDRSKDAAAGGIPQLDLTRLFLFHTDSVLEVLAVLSGHPRSVIDELEMDDSMALAYDALEVNMDFFVRRVLPVLSGAVARLLREIKDRKIDLMALAGQTQSKPSSPQDTESPTSGSTPTLASSGT